jgi:hypothetical protein
VKYLLVAARLSSNRAHKWTSREQKSAGRNIFLSPVWAGLTTLSAAVREAKSAESAHGWRRVPIQAPGSWGAGMKAASPARVSRAGDTPLWIDVRVTGEDLEREPKTGRLSRPRQARTGSRTRSQTSPWPRRAGKPNVAAEARENEIGSAGDNSRLSSGTAPRVARAPVQARDAGAVSFCFLEPRPETLAPWRRLPCGCGREDASVVVGRLREIASVPR